MACKGAREDSQRFQSWWANRFGTPQLSPLSLTDFVINLEGEGWSFFWIWHHALFSSEALQASFVVVQLRLTICDPMDCSTPGFLVLHHIPEFAQTHVHWVSDANQPSHPMAFPSPPIFNLSQHQGLFQWVGSSHQMEQSIRASASASVLPMYIQGWFPSGLASLGVYLKLSSFCLRPWFVFEYLFGTFVLLDIRLLNW